MERRRRSIHRAFWPHSRAGLASETGIKRQALHRALGRDGNPTLDTLLKVLSALGLRATVEEVPAKAA